MDSFTMQKDLHPLFAPFCNLQSAHTISRRLWRKVRISTSVARSQATARTNSTSQTPLERIYTGEDLPPPEPWSDSLTANPGQRLTVGPTA